MDTTLLPQWPARVRVTTRDGAGRWLADPPSAGWNAPERWRFADEVLDAGVWPYQEALKLASTVRQPWRHQLASAVRVEERTAVGAEARVRAHGMCLPDPAGVRCLVFGPDRVLVLRAGGRRGLLPAIEPVTAVATAPR